MQVRILRPFYFKSMKKDLLPGQLVTVPEDYGRIWVKAGMAEVPEGTATAPLIETMALSGGERAVISPEETSISKSKTKAQARTARKR